MENPPKKYKLVYPFDIKEMKKQFMQDEVSESYCGFCFHGSTFMSYVENQDIRKFKEFMTEERNSYFTKAFFVLFLMFSVTTASVVLVEHYFCVNKWIYHKNSRSYQFVVGNSNVILGVCFVFSFLLSCFMIFIKTVQRQPFNMLMLLLELLVKMICVCALTVIYKTHILIVYSITFTIFTLICVGLGHTQFDFEQGYYVAILAAIQLVTSLSVAVVTLSLLCQTLDIAVVGVAMAVCVTSFVLLIIQLLLITNGITVELTNYEYMVGAFLLFEPFFNIFMFFLRSFSYYFNVIEVPKQNPLNIQQSKRIYVWKFR